MSEESFEADEIHDALGTADQLHTDISRLKRMGIISAEEDRDAKEHIDEVAEALTEKLPEE